MNTKLTLVVALGLSMATLTAMAHEQAVPDSTSRGTPPTTRPADPYTPGSATTSGTTTPGIDGSINVQSFQNLSDGQALSVIAAIDSNEIKAARFVQSTKGGKPSGTGMSSSTGVVTDKIEDLAEDLRKDHEKNLKDATSLAKKLNLALSTTTDPARMLKLEGSQGLSTLQSASGMDLERSYVDAMISGHQKALQIIDTMTGSVTPATATSPSSTSGTSALSKQVRDFLTLTRATVAQHLQMAQALQGQASMGGGTDLH
jgi:putative membrane protein